MKKHPELKGFIRSTTLGWRHAKEGDKYVADSIRGEVAIQDNHVVIVKLKDCVIKEDELGKVYDPSNAPSIPLSGHGLTNKAYGVRKVVKKGFGQEMHTHIYLVHNGMVYTKLLKRKFYTGQVRVATAEESAKFSGVQYVIDLGEEYTGIPVLNSAIQFMERNKIDFLNNLIEWEEHSEGGFTWAKYFNR